MRGIHLLLPSALLATCAGQGKFESLSPISCPPSLSRLSDHRGGGVRVPGSAPVHPPPPGGLVPLPLLPRGLGLLLPRLLHCTSSPHLPHHRRGGVRAPLRWGVHPAPPGSLVPHLLLPLLGILWPRVPRSAAHKHQH